MNTWILRLAIFVGSFVGVALCYAFYRVTGIGMTLFSSAPAARQFADVLRLMAFATFGVSTVRRLFSISLRHSPAAGDKRRVNMRST